MIIIHDFAVVVRRRRRIEFSWKLALTAASWHPIFALSEWWSRHFILALDKWIFIAYGKAEWKEYVFGSASMRKGDLWLEKTLIKQKNNASFLQQRKRSTAKPNWNNSKSFWSVPVNICAPSRPLNLGKKQNRKEKKNTHSTYDKTQRVSYNKYKESKERHVVRGRLGFKDPHRSGGIGRRRHHEVVVVDPQWW